MRFYTKIFQEARRVNPTGIGVGLLVAKTIIEAHKGNIALEDWKQDQTVFSISFPLA